MNDEYALDKKCVFIVFGLIIIIFTYHIITGN